MYKFALEPLLNHRNFVEERLQKELATIQKLFIEEQEELLSYHEARNKLIAALEEKQRGDTTVSEVMLYVSFIDQVSADLESKKKEVVETERKLHEKRNELVVAMKKRKVLDTLKERGLIAYKHELDRSEQEFMNEVAVNQFVRGR